MAKVAIKFRCFRCNQLLGVGASKAGSVITCPKCDVALVVPGTVERGPAPEPPTGAEWGGTTPARDNPPNPLHELLAIRPEDIRVEPGVEYPRAALSATPADPTTGDSSVAEVLSDLDLGLPWSPRRPGDSAVAEPVPAAPEVVPPEPAPVLPELPAPSEPPALPQEPAPLVTTEPLPIAMERPTTARSRDAILPRTAVVAWSLFVILALGLAFVAGLMVGHFVWVVPTARGGA